MAQIALFEGAHVPRTAAREALAHGDLDAARARLARVPGAAEEAADAARLARLAAALPAEGPGSPQAVHAAFAAALAATQPRGFLSEAEWFGLYAQRVAGALAGEPRRSFRGWMGMHFALAAGDADAARGAAARAAGSAPAGPAWLEAARVAFATDEPARARAWLRDACLASPVELAARPPALEPCGVPALDAAPPLPPLPAEIEDLFDAVRQLDGLPGLRTRWIAVAGEIDRVLGPEAPGEGLSAARAPAGGGDTPADRPPDADPTSGTDLEATPDTDPEATPDADPARAFLTALRAARRSRERDGARDPGRCSDRELRARRRMQRLAPPLLDRYLRGLRGALL